MLAVPRLPKLSKTWTSCNVSCWRSPWLEECLLFKADQKPVSVRVFLNVFLGLKLNRTEQYMNLLERGREERERGVYVCVCVCVQSVLCLCVSLFFE